ncbi:MAG: glycosyltransferase family 39 protein [Planctomycetota bacterium]
MTPSPSKQGPPPPNADAPLSDPAARRVLAAVLLVALVLQLATLAQVRGYPLADSVEYLERAELVVRGERLDPGTVRSFAFSGLLAPFVALSSWAGDAVTVGLARALQMLLGLITLVVVARAGARAVDVRAGLAAAFVLAVNPVFLHWTVEPLSDTAAMLCAALAAGAAVERGGFRRGLLVGLWLGLGLLMAFKMLAVLGGFALVLLARDRWQGRAHHLGIATAVAAALFAQALMDLAVYGAFGSSLWRYFLENGAGTISTNLYEIGKKTGNVALQDWGMQLYNLAFEGVNEANQKARIDLRSQNPRDWYATHLHTHLLTWPLYACAAAGVLRSLVQLRWTTTLALVTVVLNGWMMSVKGSQSFRLWMPLLPLIALLAGSGWSWLRGQEAMGLRRAGAVLLLVVGAVLSFGIVRGTNLGKHGGYWDAMDFVNAEVAAAPARADADEPVRVAAGYHWAVRFRGRGQVEDVKLSYPLYAWGALDEVGRVAAVANLRSELERIDWFVSHQQLIEQDPAIAAAVNERFEVAAAYYEEGTYEELLPILVLRRRAEAPGAPTLFDVDEGLPPSVRQAELSHPRSVDLRRRLDLERTDQLVLLGWDAEVLPGDGNVGWLTLHWYGGPNHGHDYTVNLRLTGPEDRSRQRNRPPTWGVHPTSTWKEGWVVRDGMPFTLPAGWDDLGGPYCRGDLLPLRIWLALPRYELDEEGVPRVAGGLAPFHPSGLRPVHKERVEGRLISKEGWIFSRDNLVLVGGLFLPIPPAARVPDDGRPLVSDPNPSAGEG